MRTVRGIHSLVLALLVLPLLSPAAQAEQPNRPPTAVASAGLDLDTGQPLKEARRSPGTPSRSPATSARSTPASIEIELVNPFVARS